MDGVIRLELLPPLSRKGTLVSPRHSRRAAATQSWPCPLDPTIPTTLNPAAHRALDGMASLIETNTGAPAAQGDQAQRMLNVLGAWDGEAVPQGRLPVGRRGSGTLAAERCAPAAAARSGSFSAAAWQIVQMALGSVE